MEHKPFKGISLVLLTLALSLGTFLQVLDISIANVAVPHIAGDLGVSPNQGTWVITSFAVSNAIVLPLTGWLSKRFGEVRLFVWSTTLFSIASGLCGLAWNLPVLIIFRTLQGAVAGSLIPLSQSLLLRSYPPNKQGLALGLWSMVVIVAPVLGPVVGGYLTDNYGWPWIFYVNIPLGLLSAMITWELMRDQETKREMHPIDFTGFVLLIVGVASLQIMLDKGNDLDWMNSNVIWALAIIAIIALSYFIAWNLYSPSPVVDFSFFRSPNFVIGTFLISIGFMIFFGSTVLLPLWLQTQMGYTAYKAGLATAPIGLLPIFLSPLLGKYLTAIDTRIWTILSFLVFSISFFWLSNFTPNIGIDQVAYVRLFQGIGVTFFFIPLVTISLAGIPPYSIASASGIFNFLRLLIGSGFGTAIFVTAWNRREVYHHSYLTETLNHNPQAYIEYADALNEVHLEGHRAGAFVDNIITQQAYLLSSNDIYWICGWIFLLLIPLVFLCKPPQNQSKAVVAE